MHRATMHQVIAVGIVLCTVYVIISVAVDRWSDSFNQYQRVAAQEQAIMSREELARRKTELQSKRRQLLDKLMTTSGKYDQSVTGLVEYLNECAKEAGVRYRSLVPSASKSDGTHGTSIAFSLSLITDYHRVGQFTGILEHGSMPVALRRTELNPVRGGSSLLNATLEGSIALAPTEGIE